MNVLKEEGQFIYPTALFALYLGDSKIGLLISNYKNNRQHQAIGNSNFVGMKWQTYI